MADTCKSCKAPITWARSKLTGKPMPLDAASEKRIVIGPDGAAMVDTYVSHFATCPDADRYRKGEP